MSHSGLTCRDRRAGCRVGDQWLLSAFEDRPDRSRAHTRKHSSAEPGAVDDGKKFGSFVGAVHREALPVAAESQIGEETGGVLMEMQKCLSADIEYPRPPLDESGPGSQALQQIAQSRERSCASVFHRGVIV
jgi:hypothetical protein